MAAALQIGLIGDRDDGITAHRAIPLALALAAEELGLVVAPRWLPTEGIVDAAALEGLDGVWCVPGSPYRSLDGALRAIGWARCGGVPFLGTCGGFQHVVIEHARHVLGWADADHAETSPDAARPVISLLECALVEADETLALQPGSHLEAAYGYPSVDARYRCRYGLNPAFEAALLAGPLRANAFGPGGEVRGVELDGHPFFVATLFQPERAALGGMPPPLARALIQAAALARSAHREVLPCC